LLGKYGLLLTILALIAGIAIGFAGSTLAYRHGLLRIPGERPIQRMSRVLKLTPAQRDQIAEVMEDTRAKIQESRRDLQRQRHKLFIDAYVKIRALLTPEQQKTFDSEFVPRRLRSEAGQTEAGRGGGAPAPTAAPAQP
jgi:Spy/CpxP family protein refolding chaperone